MKIAININPVIGANKSGIGYYESELLKAYMVQSSEDVIFQYFDARNHGKSKLPEWFEGYKKQYCKFIPMSLYKLFSTFLPFPYSCIFKSKADVTVFFNYFLPPFIKGKSVVVVYDTVYKDCPETMNYKTRFSLALTLKKSIKRADRIVTISQFSKNQIINHFGVESDRIVVIPCAADKNKFGPALVNNYLPNDIAEKYSIPEKYFLYLGTLEPRKNIVRLVEAYSIAKKTHSGLPKLVIAGGKGWLYNEIFAKIEELSLDQDIIFTGYVNDEDVPQLMRYAQAFCFPSLYEGFGMPPLEAMACGTPVIVSNCTSLPEVVGECGIKVDPYSVEQIANALIKMTDPVFLSEQRELGIKQAELFSWEKSALIFKKMLEELADE